MENTIAMWDRLPEESPKAYAAFAEYRDQGPKRSLAVTAERVCGFYAGDVPGQYRVVGEGGFRPLSPAEHRRAGSMNRQVERWSSRFRWRQRAAAFDAERDRINREKRQEQADEARNRALRGAQLVQSIAYKALQQINQRPGNVEENPPASLLRYWREGVEMEFVALGLPISVVKQQVEEATPEDLDSQRRTDTLNRARKGFG